MESESPISSSRSAEISSTPRPLRRASRMWSQIAAWAPTSTPRVGWLAIRTLGSPLISRPTMSFCWLPPDSEAARTSMPGVRTSYASTMRSVSLRAPARSIHGPLTFGSSVWWPRIRFSQSGAVEQQPVPVPVLGDVADALLAPATGPPGGEVGAGETDRAGLEHPHAHDGLDQLGLAVALDPRDAEHLAAVDRERDVLDERAAVGRPDGEALAGQHHLVGHGRLAGLRGRQLAAHHQLGELPGGDLRRLHGGHRRTAPDHGDLVGDLEHLVQLVRDEDDGEAFALELAKVLEQLGDLLRHQHRGGLVEDEDLRAAVEHLEDLDALPVPDAEVLDQPVRLDVQAVGVRDLLDPPAGRCRSRASRPCWARCPARRSPGR